MGMWYLSPPTTLEVLSFSAVFIHQNQRQKSFAKTMIRFPNFKFRLNVSRDNYVSKADAIACLSKPGAKSLGKEKMAFAVKDVTVSEFLNYALSGHTFCNLFQFDPNQSYWLTTSEGKPYQSNPLYRRGLNSGYMKLGFKSDMFFYGSQVIFVDVDNTRFTDVEDYLNTLSYQPTCVYMSYSDKAQKHGVVSRRFRLVYVMDNVLNKDEFLSASNAITRQIEIDTAEPMEDDCGTRMSQYMNGVYNNDEVYCTYCIYSTDDFPAILPMQTISSTLSQIESTNITTIPQVHFDEQMTLDMGSMDYTTFMHYYSTRYRYVYRTEKNEWPYITYQLTDENYLQTWYYREKQVDGQKRRKKLFKNACLRRLMYPDIDANTLLFNLYVDLKRFFDNSDGVITLDTLKRKVKTAMEMTEEQLVSYCSWEIEYWRANRPKFIVNEEYTLTNGDIQRINQSIRWREIDQKYDRTMTVAENAVMLDIPLSTLYRFCADNQITTNPNKEKTKQDEREEKRQQRQKEKRLFLQYYDPELSIRRNKAVLHNHGLDLSVGTIQKWIHDYEDELHGLDSEIPMKDDTKLDYLDDWSMSFPKIEYEVPDFFKLY